MRGLDCSHPAHEDMHFTADDDEGLLEQERQHRYEYHPEISDDDLRTLGAQGAYRE